MAKFGKSSRKHKFKHYSVNEKLAYHSEREKSNKLSLLERKRSGYWMTGFEDNCWKTRIPALQKEFNANKQDKEMRSYNNNYLRPYINGMKARAEYEKTCTAEQRMKLYNS